MISFVTRKSVLKGVILCCLMKISNKPEKDHCDHWLVTLHCTCFSNIIWETGQKWEKSVKIHLTFNKQSNGKQIMVRTLKHILFIILWHFTPFMIFYAIWGEFYAICTDTIFYAQRENEKDCELTIMYEILIEIYQHGGHSN